MEPRPIQASHYPPGENGVSCNRLTTAQPAQRVLELHISQRQGFVT